MSEKESVTKKISTIDWLVQGALARIGDTFDGLTGRRWTPSSSLATSGLIERLKELIDSEAIEVEGKGIVVPHNITLKMQWDKFATDADDSITKLEKELLIAVADHINDRLYYTYAPLNVQVKPDYFTEGVKFLVGFEKFGDDDQQAELNVTIPGMNLTKTEASDEKLIDTTVHSYLFRFKINDIPREKRLEFRPKERHSVGRTGSNDLILDDISVSKVHASFVADKHGDLSIADLGSTNGTFINDERIAYGKAVKLVEGDRVRFGSIEVVFEHIKDAVDLPATDEDPTSSGPLSKVDTQEIDEFSQPEKTEVDK